MKKFLTAIANALNLPKHVSNHLFGKDHSKRHRVIVGLTIAALGVALSHVHAESTIVGFMAEFVGFSLHGVGLTPIIESVAGTLEV